MTHYPQPDRIADADRCTAVNKNGVRCGNYACRKGRCDYHQHEEVMARLNARLNLNEKERQWICAEMQRIHNESNPVTAQATRD